MSRKLAPTLVVVVGSAGVPVAAAPHFGGRPSPKFLRVVRSSLSITETVGLHRLVAFDEILMSAPTTGSRLTRGGAGQRATSRPSGYAGANHTLIFHPPVNAGSGDFRLRFKDRRTYRGVGDQWAGQQ